MELGGSGNVIIRRELWRRIRDWGAMWPSRETRQQHSTSRRTCALIYASPWKPVLPMKAEIYVLERDGELYAYELGIFIRTPGLELRKAVLAAQDGHSVPGTFE